MEIKFVSGKQEKMGQGILTQEWDRSKSQENANLNDAILCV